MSATFYNSHHSPIGAFATLTLGAKGAKGGLGLELGRPSGTSLYFGAETSEGGAFEALPFFDAPSGPAAEDYTIDSPLPQGPGAVLMAYRDELISRTLTPCKDFWKAGDLEFTIYNPVGELPDPEGGDDADLALALLPAVIAVLTLDNSKGSKARLLFAGTPNPDPSAGMRQVRSDGLRGFRAGLHMGMYGLESEGCSFGGGFGPDQILVPEHPGHRAFGLGENAMILATVAPGEVKSIRLVFAFHRSGPAVGGIDASYYYCRWHRSPEDVALAAFRQFESILKRAEEADAALTHPEMAPEQAHMIAMAIKSYYGSTQLLEENGRPRWVVNEGEYRMMNTFDLTVDQLFFEMKFSPWTVRNVLDQFVEGYSYYDEIAGQKALAFTHDMGVSNQFSPSGWSSYEIPGLKGCFSFMSHEELVNWALCAGIYAHKTGDRAWVERQMGVIQDCLTSLQLRDHPEPDQRDGVMSIDSPRCQGGWEITTYDSLDESLGQARASAYLALKTSAAYALLAQLLTEEKDQREARDQALKGIRSLRKWKRPDGVFPALLQSECESFTIPVIEGLIFFDQAGIWDEWMAEPDFSELVEELKSHVRVLLVQGLCLFADRGWKLSTTSRNSWLSKIYLCQHISRKLLGFGSLGSFRWSDAAHVHWLQHPESLEWAWSDQMVSGIARGSRYYPRGVTSILWLEE